jgi:hypothetical protein
MCARKIQCMKGGEAGERRQVAHLCAPEIKALQGG